MGSNDHQILDILSYVLLGIGIASSFLTLVLILSNYNQMVRSNYARLIFMIQLLILFAFCSSELDVINSNNKAVCVVFGALYYFFFFICSLFMEILLLLVYMDLTNRRKMFNKHILKLTLGVLVISLLVGFAPISTYDICYVGDHPLYCGYCFNDNKFNFGLLFDIIPIVIGAILCILLLISYRRLTQHQLSQNQKQALSSIFIPSLSVVFIIIHLVVQLLLYNSYINTERVHNQAIEVPLVLFNQLVNLVPLINLTFFLRFVGKLEEITGIKVRRCRWVFCLPKLTQWDMEDSLLS